MRSYGYLRVYGYMDICARLTAFAHALRQIDGHASIEALLHAGIRK